MPPRCGMSFMHGVEPIALYEWCEPYQCGPQTAVDVRDLTAYYAADQDILRGTNRTCERKNLVALRMPPPTSANRRASDGSCQTWRRSPTRFEHDAVLLNEASSALRCHPENIISGSRIA